MQYAKFIHESVTDGNEVPCLMYVNKKWQEIPTRNLQHRLQTSNNGLVSAEGATVCATGVHLRVRPLLSSLRHQNVTLPLNV